MDGSGCMDAEALMKKCMHVMCDRESEKTYRLKSEAGDGIMRTYRVSRGIELVYSEFESYYPMIREQMPSVDYLEIMYMVEGHAEFEMENRRVVFADKDDVCIFNSRIKARECRFGEDGIRCISIMFLLDSLKDELNSLFGTNEFDGKPLFRYVFEPDSCIRFPANEMLKNLFAELLTVPEEYGEYHRKLLVIRAIVSLLDVKSGKRPDYRYFSGDAAEKVHAARKILGENLAGVLSVEVLAERAGLNRTTLQRVFKQMYGVTIFEYKTQIRMQEAKNLLLDGKHPVTEIAGICECGSRERGGAYKGDRGTDKKQDHRHDCPQTENREKCGSDRGHRQWQDIAAGNA